MLTRFEHGSILAENNWSQKLDLKMCVSLNLTFGEEREEKKTVKDCVLLFSLNGIRKLSLLPLQHIIEEGIWDCIAF